MKKIYLFVITLIIFSFGIYIFKNYFLGGFESRLNNHIENNYIEPSKITKEPYKDILPTDNNTSNIKEDSSKLTNEDLNSVKENTIQNTDKKDNLKNIYKISFIFIPPDFNIDMLAYTNSIKIFFLSKLINEKIDSLKIENFKEKGDSRGKMKNRRIKLYGVIEMSLSEYNAVGLHEFAHYLDLYYFQKKVFSDMSDFFYNISWEGINIIKPGLVGNDFVSGYSMTNRYEDFAESFTYYVLHNNDFLEKTENSEILKKKYDFFDKYLFRDGDFKGTNFSSGDKVKSYYRDITKIDYSLVEFLKFLKK